MPSRSDVERWRAAFDEAGAKGWGDAGDWPLDSIPAMADMLERAETALRMVPPGMWHEVDDWRAEWHGEVGDA